MEVRILVDSEDQGLALTSLCRWLTDDVEVTRSAEVSLQPAADDPSEMGGAFEAINAIVSDSIALGSLIVAYQSWRDSRAQRHIVYIEDDRIRLNISGSTPATVEYIVKALCAPEDL